MDESAKRTTVVIPTYNERENIERIIPAVLAQEDRLSVLVVDDSSPDGTSEVVAQMAAREPRVQLLRRPQRAGIGPAYIAGFTHALRSKPDYIVQMDADFSHPVKDISRFLSEMPGYDIISGSRYLTGITVVNWSWDRLLISYFGNRYARRVTGLPISDLTSGFKCWRRETLERIALEQVRSNGYAFQIEMTYRAWHLGHRIKELPFIFLDRTHGDSKMNKAIAVEALWTVWWLRLMHLLGRL